MRSMLLTLGGALVLTACGSTNVNQQNYDRIKEAYEAEHGGGHHGDGHADAGHGDDHAKDDAHAKGDDHAKDDGHADGDDHAKDDAHAAAAGEDLEAGKKVYDTYCVACHGTDGKGMNGLAANLAEDKTRLAKPTEVLVKNIREGYSGEIGVMPPWGAMVSEVDAKNVIAYLRHEYPPE